MARGLAHAFKEEQLVHGDLKPANVLITAEGVAKVSDFGLSLTGGDTGPAGLIAGTDGFMAPEMIARRSGRPAHSIIRTMGNTSSSTIPMALMDALPTTKPGQRLGLVAFGGGITSSGSVLIMRAHTSLFARSPGLIRKIPLRSA